MPTKCFHVAILLTLMFLGAQVIGEEGMPGPQTLSVTDLKVMDLEKIRPGACADPLTDDRDWGWIRFSDIPQNRSLCLRKWFDLQDQQAPANPALLIGLLASTNVYWDGLLLLNNGSPGLTASEESVGRVQTLKRLPVASLRAGRHLLSIELSSYHVGAELEGIAYILAILDGGSLQETILGISIISAFLAGALIILAIFFQMLFSLYYRDRSFQIFAALCLSATLLLLVEQWKLWVFYPYDWHFTRINLILGLTFLTSFLLPGFYLYHYRRLADGNNHLSLKLFGLLAALLLSAWIPEGFDRKSLFLFATAIVASLMQCVWALYKQRSGAVINVILLVLSLICLIELPFVFTEFGFASMLALLMPAMLNNLIGELRRNRDKALTAERLKSELLRRNLQPHFLMNSLTHLIELIEVLPAQAVEFVAQLADEFRMLLRLSNQNVITLDEELALCRSHLKIMSSRYQQTYSLDVIGSTASVVIPSAVLHSQIENCFTHNRISSDRTFELSVKTTGERVSLLLKTPIENSVEHDSTGIGDAYVKAKLAETCVSSWHFNWERKEDEWLVLIEYEVRPELVTARELDPCTL